MTASFLRASLFTSVVSFGVAAMAVGLGITLLIAGYGLFSLSKAADVETQIAVGARARSSISRTSATVRRGLAGCRGPYPSRSSTWGCPRLATSSTKRRRRDDTSSGDVSRPVDTWLTVAVSSTCSNARLRTQPACLVVGHCQDDREQRLMLELR